MTTAAPSTALVTIQPAFTDPERLALTGFLAGYRGLTREAYALDLRQFTALDRNELGALLVAAGLGSPVEHALISLLALNGLRVSEATGADIEHLGVQRGHRTLTITRKGGKVVTIPLPPRTARAIDLAVGERCDGPVFLTADGRGARPARRRTDRAAGRPPCRDHQTCRSADAAARIHHRCTGCRGAAA
jgi:integrase